MAMIKNIKNVDKATGELYKAVQGLDVSETLQAVEWLLAGVAGLAGQHREEHTAYVLNNAFGRVAKYREEVEAELAKRGPKYF